MRRLSEREGVPERQQPEPRIGIGFGKVVFYVNAQTSVQINGQSIALLKGKIKFSDASIEAKASGSVSISAGMIKIG